MVEFKTKNGMASLESQIVVTPQMAELLKSNDKRVKAFIKDAKLKVEHAVIEDKSEDKSVLGLQITETDAMETINRLEKVHRELLGVFEKEESEMIHKEDTKDIETVSESLMELAKSTENIGVCMVIFDLQNDTMQVKSNVNPGMAVAGLMCAIHDHQKD